MQKMTKITVIKTRKETVKWKQKRQLIRHKEPKKAALKIGHSNPATAETPNSPDCHL